MQRLPKILYAALIGACLLASTGCTVPLETFGKNESGNETVSTNQSESRDTDINNPNLVAAENVNGEYVYHIPERYYSEGIKNIVRRDRQIYEMKWVPLADLTGFNGDYVFAKGREVKGIPYGQPVYSGLFVGYEATVDEFYAQSKLKNGLFYTGYSEYEEISTYYSLDCTTFVCYAWDTEVRMYTSVLVRFGDDMGNKLKNLQVGDALIRTGDDAHAVLITGIVEDDDGNIVWVEVIEQTPPLTKLTRYGNGELYSLDEFVVWYLDDGYKIYRNTDYRDATPYTRSRAVAIDGETGKNGASPYRKLDVDVSDGKVSISGLFAGDETVKGFSYMITPYFYGLEKYKTRADSSLRLRSRPTDGETYDYIPPETVLTVMDIYIDRAGERWGKLRYNGHCGWIWLEGSELLGGSLEKYDLINIPDENCYTQTVDGYSYVGLKTVFDIPQTSFTQDSRVIICAHTTGGNTYEVGTAFIRLRNK